MPNESPNKSLLSTIINMIDTIAHEGNGYDTLINLLSLLCLLSILSRLQPPTLSPSPQTSQPMPATNPLQKILGDLTKSMDGTSGGGGPSPDMLMSLLPLLNNPQVKSKLNPANISNILGLMNNLGSNTTTNDKPESPKPEKTEKKETTTPIANADASDQDKKELGRSLNWKTNFQNEKEM